MKTVRRIPRGPMLACAALVAIGVGGAAAVSEAFDEPLGMQEVLNIIRPFLAG